MLVLVLCAAATVALILMFEAVIKARLSFGTALAVVLPLLVAARSCGGAWVARSQTPAGIRPILGYGAWFALLALILFVLHSFALRLWLGLDPAETAQALASRPLTMLTVAALAYATCALITCAGFALGARAQSRLLPRP
ncbi:MAG: hypothetical protein U1A24_18735 [Cypionkella sp.]|nr:hypothetical protein [Cypionkella sp.]MDZ4312590.1 hypothetical protein [Cypionkella sp.]MDZ4393220.1 hypothetical protein [Cypionkella sp.]